jgi:Ca2+-binding RTX toxin-like protein
MKGNDVLFGEGQDDDLIGGYGNDWISGGTGNDGVIGDDGRIMTSRNATTYGEALHGVIRLKARQRRHAAPSTAT